MNFKIPIGIDNVYNAVKIPNVSHVWVNKKLANKATMINKGTIMEAFILLFFNEMVGIRLVSKYETKHIHSPQKR